MKKVFLVLAGFLFSQPVMAWQNCGDIEEGVPSNCEYEIADGVLTIRPQDNTKEATIPDYPRDNTYERYPRATTTSPFRWDENADTVTTVKIESGISSVGAYAFEDMGFTTVILPEGLTSIKNSAFKECDYLSSVNLPSSLREIESGAFAGTSLTNVVIPAGTADNPTIVGATAFRGAADTNERGVYGLQLESFVVGENTVLDAEIFLQAIKTDTYPLMNLENFKMYCAEGNQSCVDAMAKTVEIAQKRGLIDSSKTAQDYIETYTKDADGLYKIGTSFYANADLMAKGKACTSKQNCKDILAAQAEGKAFNIGLRVYNSLDDFLNDNRVIRRIYTVGEANEAAGKKNKLMIRYK